MLQAYEQFKQAVSSGQTQPDHLEISLSVALLHPDLHHLPKVQKAQAALVSLVREEEQGNPRHRFADDSVPILLHTTWPSVLSYHRGQDTLIKYVEDEEVMRLLSPFWGAQVVPDSLTGNYQFQIKNGQWNTTYISSGIPLKREPQTIDTPPYRRGDNFLPYTLLPGDEALVIGLLLEKADRIWQDGKEQADEALPGPFIQGKSTQEIEQTLSQLLTIFERRELLLRQQATRITLTVTDVRSLLKHAAPTSTLPASRTSTHKKKERPA